MSRTTLKLIAIIAMTINHIGVFLKHKGIHTNTLWEFSYHMIGAITFPILLLLLMEGYERTSNYRNYCIRIFLAFLVSIIPYTLMFPDARLTGNIMWTLFVCLIALKYIETHTIMTFLLAYCVTFTSDWGNFAIPMLFLAYYLGKHKMLLILMSMFSIPVILRNADTIEPSTIAYPAGVALAFFCYTWYNGKESSCKHIKLINQMFYWYYPVHLVVIWWITNKL